MKMIQYRISSVIVLFSLLNSVSAFSIRLTGGVTSYMGRVEVNFDDGHGWGTVCDDGWDEDDAKVVCRSLNLEYRFAIPLGNAIFGEGTGVTQMDDVQCRGSESSLRYCSYTDRDNENCGHSEDASVNCWHFSLGDSFSAHMENLDSRIRSPLDGLLLLRNTGAENYGICSNNFGIEEARVACYELGHDRNRSVTFDVANSKHDLGHCNRITFTCRGTEQRLSSCRRALTFGPCKYNAPVSPGIACNYERVNEVRIYGTGIKGNELMVNKGESIEIYCESDYARPKPKLTWHLNSIIHPSGVHNFTTVLNAKYKVKSTLTMIPTENDHGQTLSCCSEDSTGYKICSNKYDIYVKVLPQAPTLKILYQRNSDNSEMTLTCISSRTRPKVELKWYKNGMVVNESTGLSLKVEATSLSHEVFETKSMITGTEGSSIKNGDFFQCEASVDEYREIIHVPIILLSEEQGSPDFKGVSFNGETEHVPIGQIIAFAMLGLGVVLLSLANICLIRRNKEQEHSTSQTHRCNMCNTSGERFENKTYTADSNEINVQLENYEQLEVPQVPQRKVSRQEEGTYENTKLPRKAKK